MLIKNARVYDVNGERAVDVRIENGLISELGVGLEGGEVFDATGLLLLPSLVDTNVRLLDGSLNAKNIASLASEAKEGGVGKIVLNADSLPALDNEVVLEFAQHGVSSVQDVGIELMINALQEDGSLSNIAILLKRGAIVPYMSTVAKNDVAIKVAEYAKMYGVTLFCKAEDNSLIRAGVMLDGDVSSELGLAGIPYLSEVLHVSRMIEIARHFGIKILFKSIASPRSIELITKAKNEGLDVSCEVSIHHLIHSDRACEGFNTLAKLNPPLASYEDMLTLQKMLQNKEIDMLTTLHQPASPINKEVAFFDAAYGCSALSIALPLYYTKLVKSGIISLTELIRLTTQNAASAIDLKAGVIAVGEAANVVLFDPNTTTPVEDAGSLYNKEILTGKVLSVL